jgi:ferredoxin
MPRITFYRSKCIGCGACVEAAPHRWLMSNKDGKSILIRGQLNKTVYQVDIGEHEAEENAKAAESCPVHIIRLSGR